MALPAKVSLRRPARKPGPGQPAAIGGSRLSGALPASRCAAIWQLGPHARWPILPCAPRCGPARHSSNSTPEWVAWLALTANGRPCPRQPEGYDAPPCQRHHVLPIAVGRPSVEQKSTAPLSWSPSWKQQAMRSCNPTHTRLPASSIREQMKSHLSSSALTVFRIALLRLPQTQSTTFVSHSTSSGIRLGHRVFLDYERCISRWISGTPKRLMPASVLRSGHITRLVQLS